MYKCALRLFGPVEVPPTDDRWHYHSPLPRVQLLPSWSQIQTSIRVLKFGILKAWYIDVLLHIGYYSYIVQFFFICLGDCYHNALDKSKYTPSGHRALNQHWNNALIQCHVVVLNQRWDATLMQCWFNIVNVDATLFHQRWVNLQIQCWIHIRSTLIRWINVDSICKFNQKPTLI